MPNQGMLTNGQHRLGTVLVLILLASPGSATENDNVQIRTSYALAVK